MPDMGIQVLPASS